MFLIDSHCHLNLLKKNKNFKSINSIIKESFLKNVKMFLSISTSIKDFIEMEKITKKKKIYFYLVVCILYTNMIKQI